MNFYLFSAFFETLIYLLGFLSISIFVVIFVIAITFIFICIYILLVETPLRIIKETLDFRRKRKIQEQIRERTIQRKQARREQHKNNKRIKNGIY